MTSPNPLPYDFDLTRLVAQLPPDWQLHYFAEIESTNDWALDRYRVQAATTTAFILARMQTKGRGRADRSWQAATGNLTCSLAFPLVTSPSNSGTETTAAALAWPARLAIETALAVWETAHEFLPGDRCQLKWPNDLLVDGKKAAGILIESCLGKVNGDGTTPSSQTIVIGIGLNVNTIPTSESATPPFQRGLEPISLAAAAGSRFDLTDVAATLGGHLASRLSSIRPPNRSRPSSTSNSDDSKIIAEFNQHLAWRDQLVSLRQGTEVVQGILSGVEQNGFLMLSTAAGPRSFGAGELRPIE